MSLLQAIIFSALAVPLTATAQATYKCTENGKSVYSDKPCGRTAKVLAVGESAEEKERLRQAARDRQRAAEAMAAAVAEVRRENAARPAPRDLRAERRAEPSLEEYCNGLLKKAKSAKDEAAMYRYHQGLIDDAKRRQKEAEDEHFSKCYGTVR